MSNRSTFVALEPKKILWNQVVSNILRFFHKVCASHGLSSLTDSHNDLISRHIQLGEKFI